MRSVLKNDSFLKMLTLGIKIEDINPSKFYNIKEIIDQHRTKIFDKPEISKLISATLGLLNEWIMNIYSKLELQYAMEDWNPVFLFVYI